MRIGHFWFPRYRRSSLLPGLGLRLALQVKIFNCDAMFSFQTSEEAFIILFFFKSVMKYFSEEAHLPHEPDLLALSHPHNGCRYLLLCSKRPGASR